MPDDGQPETLGVKFLTLEEVLEIHEALLREFGGPPGVRDLGLLESGLYRPYHSRPELACSSLLQISTLLDHALQSGLKA